MSNLTKKDYELIAGAIRKTKYEVYHNFNAIETSTILIGLAQLENELMDKLEDENPKFDREKFGEACQMYT